ncbi:hypothetical protein Tco_0956011 [Tanacetum coccineum]|uniref:BTB domain-containing protein n=1 Tax=Tanacetum coccineum TaxID=301880 RepID=A0ABQ5E8S0_9ASTR
MCFKAFTISADIPEILMQQFWYTIKKVQDTDSYEFILANKKCIINTEVFRTILDICPRVEGVDLIDVPDDDTALTFLIDLGYKGPLNMHTNMFVDHMHQPWRTLAAIINKCLFGKTASNEKLKKSIIDILWGMFNRANVDYPALIWEDIAYQIDHRKEKRSRRKKTADIPVEEVEVSEESDPEPAKRKTSRKRRVKKKVTLSTDDNIIFDDPDAALELAKSISQTKAEEAKAARKKSGGRSSKSVVIQYTPSTPKSKPATSKAKLKGTGGSNEGTGRIPGVPDESTFISTTSSEGTSTKPGVPDEEKDITKEKVILEWGDEDDDDYDDLEKDDKDGEADDEGDDHVSDTQDTDDEDVKTESDDDDIYKYKIRVRKDGDEEIKDVEVQESHKGDEEVTDVAVSHVLINGKHSDTVPPRSIITHYLHATSTTQQQLCPTTFIQHELHATTNAESQRLSDPTTAMNMTLALLAKALKLNTIPTNNNQRSSLIPRNSQIARPGMNTSQDMKMKMVDDNDGNQVRHNAVQNDGNKIRQNAVQNPGIQMVENMNGLGVVPEITDQYRNGNVVTARTKGNEEEAGIQSTQKELEFMDDADAYDKTKRVTVNCTSDDTLQQASTSGTQSDNAPVYDSDGSAEGKSSDTQCASNTLDSVSQKLEDENMSLEFQVWNYAKENEHLKTTYKNLFNSIKVTQAQTKSIIDSLQKQLHNTIYENAKLRAQLFDKVSERKDTTKGTSTNTLFTKQSILGKPPSSSSSGSKLYSVTPFPKSSVLPKVDKKNALSKPVTSNSAPSTRESKVVQTVNVIAPRIFRPNPSKTSRVDNVVPNKPVKTSVRIKPITVSQPNVIHKQQANSDSNGFSPTKVNNTAKTRRPHPRSNSNTDRVQSKSKSSCLSNNNEKIEENHRNS